MIQVNFDFFFFKLSFFSGRSNRMFGFVTFNFPQEADKAINNLHDQELDGRRIKVNVFNNRRGPGDAGSGGGGYNSREGDFNNQRGGYGGGGSYGGSGGYSGGYSGGGYGGGYQ